MLEQNNDTIIWVNRGWIPLDKKTEFENIKSHQNTYSVNGLLKKAEHLEIRKKDRDLFEQSTDYHIVDVEKFNKQLNYKKAYENFFIEEVIRTDDNSDDLYPCPSTRYNYNKPYLTPEKHLEYSTFWGICTSIGLLSLIKIFKL